MKNSRKANTSRSKNIMILIGTPPTGQWPKKEWKGYLQELEELLDAIFWEVSRQGLTDTELDEKAGLSYSTVYNIAEGHTGQPRLSTVWKLAKALGMQLTLARPKTSKRIA